MRAVVQRVSRARVTVAGEAVGAIDHGLVVLLGVAAGDDDADVSYMADKVANLRVFDDGEGRMNLSLVDTGGAALVVSQFTLHGDCRKGRRPSFTVAAPPDAAEMLYQRFVDRLAGFGVPVETGRFGAMMMVEIVGDGPVTILLDSERLF